MEMNERDILELKKDLCARLPYGVIVVDVDAMGEPISRHYTLRNFDVEDFKNDDHPLPYLRPMSSMTMSERMELSEVEHIENSDCLTFDEARCIETNDRVDWLNRKMFDHRGLIPKGLALVASEGMYNKKEKEKEKTDTELLNMLLEAIDYSFLKTNGTYDLELTHPVIDKVKYIKKVRKQDETFWGAK